MNKIVNLSLGSGSLSTGFAHVVVQIWGNKEAGPTKTFGQLPIAADIIDLYRHWQAAYLAIHQPVDSCRIRYADSGLNHLSGLSFGELRQSLSTRINAWLNSDSFRNVDQQLRKLLFADDEIEFIIETGDRLLRRLPWHLWEFFEDYPKAEVVLSAPKYERSNQELIISPGTQVRILAVFGDKEGIDLKKDLALLKKLSSQSEIKVLPEPQREELYEQIEKGWHILFFAGHSYSKEKGIIQINKTDSLSLDELANSLEKSISKGLKLAIFNSCDGLGLAEALTDLHIPQVIVMKEPVPDVVAQEFLKKFLEFFSSGQSLSASVHEGRKSLQKLEFRYPCATWLPVVFRNPSEKAITWQDLCGRVEESTILDNGRRQQNRPNFFGSRRRLLQTVLISSVAVTALVMGSRYLGWLQSVELIAFDQTMRWRPENRPGEGADHRFLVVTIDEDDLNLPEQGKGEKILPSAQASAKEKSLSPEQALAKEKSSLSDHALTILLKKLRAFKAKAIGLDVYRDFEATNQGNLKTIMKSNGNFFAICRVRVLQNQEHGILPPPEIPDERRGFSDVVVDGDRVMRRHLLAMRANATSGCVTPYALSTRLAFHYLNGRGIVPKFNNQKDLQLGNVVFKRLRNHMGGYQVIDDWGYQILLNYRSSHDSPSLFVPQVSLKVALSDQLRSEFVKDKIVLIGVTARSTGNDYFQSPYSTGKTTDDDVPGVIMQAQMASQIVSAALKERPLLSVWPWWAEVIWIWVWSVIGGSLFWWTRAPINLVAAIIGLEVCLCVFCWGLLVFYAVWVPLVPAGLVLVCSTVGVAAAMNSSRDSV